MLNSVGNICPAALWKLENMNREHMISYLKSCSDSEFLKILCDVLPCRKILPEEKDYAEHKLVLGLASRELESELNEPKGWGGWQISLVADHDPNAYEGEFIGEPFCQHGSCMSCSVEIDCHAKQAICPVCSAKVLCT